MQWIDPETGKTDEDEVARAWAAELGLHPLAARVLVARGHLSAEQVNTFLADGLADLPSPGTMKGMAPAVERLERAVRGREKITLYGDYDVDGVSSTALLSLFLEALGAQVATYIPHRLDEGYGLNLPAVERICEDGTRVLVTLDCGITSVAEVALARERGLSVVVVDHHTVPETLPPALAILNPHQKGCDYPCKDLCAAGVAFNLCLGLRKRLRETGFFEGRPEPNLKRYLDLVALATVADVVPLRGANRILVKHGLKLLTSGGRPGVRALKEVAGLLPSAEVSTGQVGFKLGPRINAAGRLADASVGLSLLRSESMDEARRLAQVLDSANAERQTVEKQMLDEALAMAQGRTAARGLVLASEGWHAGVVGIVASRVVERFHRPAVVIALKDGVGKGSGRSIEGFHLFDALQACSGHLARFGGHKHAAGLTVEAARLPAFTEAFEKVASARLDEADLVPRCRIDAWVRPEELDYALVEGLARLAPFGSGNPEPLLAVRGTTARARKLASKKTGGPGHLKLSLQEAPDLDAIGFGLADAWPDRAEDRVDLAFHFGLDTFRGETRLSMKLKALRPGG